MLIEQPPLLFRMTIPKGIFRIQGSGQRKIVYLTFDDGPIPESTPWVLDTLDRYGIKATFFMVGDNVRRYPELYTEIRKRGHNVGNHTMHHLQGAHVTTTRYLRDVTEASDLIGGNLFRPPHGWLRPRQAKALSKRYKVVMYDLVTRDYSFRLTAEDVFRNVKRYVRDGSIIVFHDSLKSLPRIRESLPKSLDWLIAQGYEFGLIDDGLR